MAVNDLYRLNVEYAISDEWCFNKLLYRVEEQSVPDGQVAGVLNAHFHNQVIIARWLDVAAINVEFVRLYTRRVWPAPEIPNARSINEVGVEVTQAAPPCSPCCLSLYGTPAGRGTRGRIWISGHSESQVVSGVLTQSAFDLTVLLADTLFNLPVPAAPGETRFQLMVQSANLLNVVPCNQIRVHPELRVRRTRIRRPHVA